MPPLITIDDDDSATDCSDMPPLIAVNDDDSDTDYSDVIYNDCKSDTDILQHISDIR
jgi:predicted lipoprotein with Yx(FWY)xxD motif